MDQPGASRVGLGDEMCSGTAVARFSHDVVELALIGDVDRFAAVLADDPHESNCRQTPWDAPRAESPYGCGSEGLGANGPVRSTTNQTVKNAGDSSGLLPVLGIAVLRSRELGRRGTRELVDITSGMSHLRGIGGRNHVPAVLGWVMGQIASQRHVRGGPDASQPATITPGVAGCDDEDTDSQ